MKYIIRYGEIGVKSPKIRRKFENRLSENIQTVLDAQIDIDQGRMILETSEKPETVNQYLTKIFGIVSYSPIIETVAEKSILTKTIEDLIDKLLEEKEFDPKKTFAIKCRRVGKHNYSSQQIAGYCGSVVIKKTNAPVNLSNPDFTLYVEIRDDKAYLYHEKIQCLGGLPVGTQGRVLVLVSSGIDSPVAVYSMLKRGCSVSILHFNNSPYTSGDMDKVISNINQLKKYSVGSKIESFVVNYGDYLKQVQIDAPPRMTCILCKSGMYQVAQKLAKDRNCQAIVDGSSIGQVASQTLPNIQASRYHCNMPIFSPLIGMDKIEIENLGKQIGTYEISILPDSGCSAVPKYPETNADLDLVIDTEEKINIESLVDKVYETCTKIKKE